jgi:hypothetical protein
MALNILKFSLLPLNSTGTSDTGAGITITTLLETFVPGYATIYETILQILGIDMTTLIFIVWLVGKIVPRVRATIKRFILWALTSEISIDSTDEKLLNAVLLHASHLEAGSRKLYAKIKKNGPEPDGKREKFKKVAVSTNKDIELLDFSN